MTKAVLLKKQEEVSKVAEELKSAASVVVVDYLGLTVDEVTNLRRPNRYRVQRIRSCSASESYRRIREES